MNRRDVLAATGLAVAGSAGAWYLFRPSEGVDFEHPGTIDETFVTNGNYPTDEDPADGMPPQFPDPPAAPDVDESTFETLETSGESVRLAPIDVVEKWYRRREARFVDARRMGGFKHSHVYGSVLSSAQQGSSGGGIASWSTDDRIVTYCGCPHHLSSLRAAGLQKAGFSNVFALDEGFGEWFDRGYPMAGTTFASDRQSEADVAEWTLEGVVDSRHAGEYAWASTDGHQEAAPIRDDGTYTLVLEFATVTSETPIEVATPDYTVTRPLGELAATTIDGS